MLQPRCQLTALLLAVTHRICSFSRFHCHDPCAAAAAAALQSACERVSVCAKREYLLRLRSCSLAGSRLSLPLSLSRSTTQTWQSTPNMDSPLTPSLTHSLALSHPLSRGPLALVFCSFSLSPSLTRLLHQSTGVHTRRAPTTASLASCLCTFPPTDWRQTPSSRFPLSLFPSLHPKPGNAERERDAGSSGRSIGRRSCT